jgi:hypothetical protein
MCGHPIADRVAAEGDRTANVEVSETDQSYSDLRRCRLHVISENRCT